MSTSAMCVAIVWPRVPVALSERTMTLRVRLPTCGRKSSTLFKSRAPRWSYCRPLFSVSGPAVRGNGLHGALFPLVDGVHPAAAGHFAFLDVARVRQDEPVADPPARRPLPTASTWCGPRAARWRGARTSASSRCRASTPCPASSGRCRTVTGRPRCRRASVLAMMISAVTLAAIGVGGGAHFEDPGRPHPHLAGHHLQVRDLQPRIDGRGERELAVDRDRVRDRGRVVDRDGVAREDADHMNCWSGLARPARWRRWTNCRSARSARRAARCRGKSPECFPEVSTPSRVTLAMIGASSTMAASHFTSCEPRVCGGGKLCARAASGDSS